MPLAGSKDADRARAHLRWAERYSRHDEPHKAAAHFGRALEYDSRSTKSQKFGVGGQDTELMRHMANAGATAAATGIVVGAAALPYVTDAAYKAGSNVLQVAKGAAKQVSDYMWPPTYRVHGHDVKGDLKTDQPAMDGYGGKTDQPEMDGHGGKTDQPEMDGHSGKTDQRATDEYGGKTDQRSTDEYGGKTDQRATDEYGGKTDQRATEEYGGKTDQRATEEYSGKTDQRATDVYGGKTDQRAMDVYGGKTDQRAMDVYGGKTDQRAMDVYGGKTDYAPKISDARSSRGSYPLLGPAEARPNKSTIGRGIPSGSWPPPDPRGSW